MGKTPRRQTFADLAKEPTWSQTDAPRQGRLAPRPGGFNGAGEFFDLEGGELLLVVGAATAEEVQQLVEACAAVVTDACGCGGSSNGCTPEWVTDDQLSELRRGSAPRFTGRHDAPTWIDVWANDTRTVVFTHGDVSWGAPLP